MCWCALLTVECHKEINRTSCTAKPVGANNKDRVASVVLSLFSDMCHLILMMHMFLMLRVTINGDVYCSL